MSKQEMMSTVYDDAVIGAGIIGLAHAYHLARRGRRVAVFERGEAAAGASRRNFGMIWPVGQPAGDGLSTALQSARIWRELGLNARFWAEPTGSVHLAYEDDELAVLKEFSADAGALGYECELIEPSEVVARSSLVCEAGLLGGLWSATELCVDPREALDAIPRYLANLFDVQFHFNCPVTAVSGQIIMAGGCSYEAGHVWVCSGSDLTTLYPSCFQQSGLFPCKLQMMRSAPVGPEARRLGPMLAGGLTLRHYKSFERCSSLRYVKARVARDRPELDKYGIHVMACQNGRSEIVIGDSHEYGSDISLFDSVSIDRYILDYLHGFLNVPGMEIASRWHGVYVKHPTDPWFIAHPEPDVTVVTGLGGAGMTLSFGLAEKTVEMVCGA